MTGARLRFVSALAGACLAGTAALGQAVAAQGGGGTTINVVGRVVNAVNGTPIPRALVNLNSRAVLTDSLGKFEFPAFVPYGSQTATMNAPQAYVKVTKPGYSAALDAMEAMGQQPVSDLTSPLELKIYPDGLIYGVVVGSDRQPLAKVQVSLYREMGDEAQRRLMPVGTTQTNSRGEYRFDEGGGRYALMVRYMPRLEETGEAVLPLRFPEGDGGEASTSFVVNSGEERKIDLQVKTGAAYPVTFRADGDSEGVRNIRMVVKPSGGPVFTAFAQPSRTQGEFHVELPSGSYQLRAIEQTRERRTEADGHVTVAGKPVNGLTMHFAELPSIPVQVVVDAAANATANSSSATNIAPTVPTAQNLNLYLREAGDVGESETGDVRVATLPDKSFAFQPSSGVYRLAGQMGGAWFVERASYGSTDLLTQSLTVAAGSGTDVIRVLVSNAMGQVTGTVRRGGVPAAGFVYLISYEVSLTPLYTTQVRSDGTYQMRVPPGSYTVVAFEHRFPGDLKKAEVAGHLAGAAGTTVAASGKASLDLELQRVEAIQ